MPHLRVEIRDFAELVCNLANLRRPLFSQRYTGRKWFFKFDLEVTLHELEMVRDAGPVVIEVEANADATRLLVGARIPMLHVRSRCTVTGGGILIKDGTRSLEVDVNGGFTGNIQLTESEAGVVACDVAEIDLQGFQFRFHVFPGWLERRFQRPIERALEDELARLIGDAIVAQRLQLAAAAPTAPARIASSDSPQRETDKPVLRRGRLASLAYGSSYYLAYGLVFPVLLMASTVPAENAVVEGLRDGARSARDAVAERRPRRAAESTAGRDAPRAVALVPAS